MVETVIHFTRQMLLADSNNRHTAYLTYGT